MKGWRDGFAGDACRSRVYRGEPSRIIMGNGGVGPYNLVYVQLSLGFGDHFLFYLRRRVVFVTRTCFNIFKT